MWYAYAYCKQKKEKLFFQYVIRMSKLEHCVLIKWQFHYKFLINFYTVFMNTYKSMHHNGSTKCSACLSLMWLGWWTKLEIWLIIYSKIKFRIVNIMFIENIYILLLLTIVTVVFWLKIYYIIFLVLSLCIY